MGDAKEMEGYKVVQVGCGKERKKFVSRFHAAD